MTELNLTVQYLRIQGIIYPQINITNQRPWVLSLCHGSHLNATLKRLNTESKHELGKSNIFFQITVGSQTQFAALKNLDKYVS